MNKTNYTLLLIASILVFSCTNKPTQEQSDEVTPIELDFQQKMKSVHDINLITDVDIISLDCDEVIISKIDKVIKYDKIIYLKHRIQNKRV